MKAGITIIIFYLVFCNQLGAQNFTNKGKEFWVGYGHNHLFNYDGAPNSQSMILYLSAEQPATVTVSVNGTSWTRTYTIPANTVMPSDLMPKEGPDDCRLMAEGTSNRAIHIVSDVPIVAFAHTYGLNTSGGTMLLPVESYNYTYFSINSEQTITDSCYSWFYIVANEDNTKIRITPVRPTLGGRMQNVPFEVTLNKGEIYNVMGKLQTNGNGFDMSGSKIQSIPGEDGRCHPVGVFSGSSRTGICVNFNYFLDSGSDFNMGQVLPVTAWGTRYVLAMTSSADGPALLNNNRVRVYLRDKNTTVKVNGNVLTGLSNNFFYEYLATSSDIITANKPVMVAQFVTSGYGCGSTGDGDPEMFYISPVDQAIKSAFWYNTDQQNIEVNYVTLVIPDGGIASLKIDGSNLFDTTYAHPNAPGYTVVVKKLPLAPMQHNAQSDSGFTAVTYGLGHVESYGYNAGTYIKNLEATVQVKNEFGNAASAVTCAGTSFGIRLKTTYKPSVILWNLGHVSALTPNSDVTQTDPQPADSITEGGRKYYLYQLPGNYTFDSTGTYEIPVTVTDARIENCSFSVDISIPVDVIAGPDVDFTNSPLLCSNNKVTFSGLPVTGISAKDWKWQFGDNTIDSVQQVTKVYPVATLYNVRLQAIRAIDGCTGFKERSITINPSPAAVFKLQDSIICMPGGGASFVDQSSVAGSAALQYKWDFGDNTSSVSQQPVHNYASAGSYLVKLSLTVDGSGCKDSTSLKVAGFATKPTANFGPAPGSICAATTIQFIDLSTPGSIIKNRQWFFNNGLFSTDDTPLKSFDSPGNHEIKLVVKNNSGCTDTVVKAWQVFPLPIVNAGPDKIVTPNSSVQLEGSVADPSGTFAWSPATGLNATNILNPVASLQASRLYYLAATDKNNCIAKDSVLVQVLTTLYVPGAFSPNNDGLNDDWKIPALKLYDHATVIIFNRYGQKVFESQNYKIPWDGRYKGTAQPAGAYIYIIDTHSPIGGRVQGTVMIVR